MSKLERRPQEHHHSEDECCAHDRTPTAEFAPNLNVAGNFHTTLQVSGVDCAEEVSAIHRALKPLSGVREVKVNMMSGRAIIIHGENVRPEALMKAIGDEGLSARRINARRSAVGRPRLCRNN
jgi:Cd2+/Zn2+-exporting ATPase